MELLRDGLREIRDGLGRIERVLEQYVKAVNDAQNRHEEKQHQPIEVSAVIRNADAIEREHTANQKRSQRTQDAIAVAAWTAFVAALAYAVIAQLQLGELRKQTAQLYRQAEVENADASYKAVETFRQLTIAQQQAQAARDGVSAINRQMQLDQRAWVGVQAMSGRADSQSDGNFRLQVEIILKNTGKTPAIKMGGEMIALDRSWKEPIPEFDKEAAASSKRLKESLRGILERTPKESRAYLAAQLQKIGAQMIIPKGEVLAPEATRPVSLTPGINYFVSDPAKNKPVPSVEYILGKFTYSDIFQVKEHSTKVCVMWRGGDTKPQICPEGNGME